MDHGLHCVRVLGIVETHVLNVAAFAKVKVLKLVVLLLKGRDFFGHVHMEGVREVFRTVVRRMAEDIVNALLGAEGVVLLSLRRAEAFGGRAVDRIEPPVLLLEDVDARLQMTEHFFGESAALFKQTLARPEEGGFIERRDAEGRRHVADQIAHFIVGILRAFIEAPLREGERVRRALLAADDVVALLEEFADHFQTLVEFGPESGAPIVRMLELHQADDERNIEAHSADVAAADRHIAALFVMPGREIGAAAHRARNDTVFTEEL